jgi:predicted Zn-dependent protease
MDMRKIFLTLTVTLVSGCAGDHASLDNHQNTARIDQNLTQQYQIATSPTEEYISRVAKRVILVNNKFDNNYTFNVIASSDPVLTLDAETHNIDISMGVLHQLKDEAELAAAITYAMARIQNFSNVDRETARTLAMAGYDPQAMLELQEEYFHAANSQQYHWLRNIFPLPPSAGTIDANKIMLKNMPKGLARDKESYVKIING